jgi:hypothetical protein
LDRSSTNAQKYANVEQKTRAFLENLQEQGGPPIYTLSPKEARIVLSDLQASVRIEKLPADIENRSIPVGPVTYQLLSLGLRKAPKLFLS